VTTAAYRATFPSLRWPILVGLVTAAMLETLDVTITNVALPQIQGNIGATRQEIGWVSTGYIISNVIVLPMTAWLASRFGRRRYLLSSILLFVAASICCGFSTTLNSLVGFRVLQGAAGAALLSTGEATLFQIFPRGERELATGIFGLGVIMGANRACFGRMDNRQLFLALDLLHQSPDRTGISLHHFAAPGRSAAVCAYSNS